MEMFIDWIIEYVEYIILSLLAFIAGKIGLKKTNTQLIAKLKKKNKKLIAKAEKNQRKLKNCKRKVKSNVTSTSKKRTNLEST